jgi:hypothetical protein
VISLADEYVKVSSVIETKNLTKRTAGGFVYRTVCIPTGKVYVGIHTKGCRSYLGSGKVLRSAILKYGRDSFVREVIATFETIKEGCALERKWIAELNSKAPNGMNLCDGGEGVFNPCDEIRKLIGKASAGNTYAKGNRGNTKGGWSKGLTKETDTRMAKISRAISKAMIGNTCGKGNKGKPLSKAHKAVLSIVMLGNTNAKSKRHSKLS